MPLRPGNSTIVVPAYAYYFVHVIYCIYITYYVTHYIIYIFCRYIYYVLISPVRFVCEREYVCVCVCVCVLWQPYNVVPSSPSSPSSPGGPCRPRLPCAPASPPGPLCPICRDAFVCVCVCNRTSM